MRRPLKLASYLMIWLMTAVPALVGQVVINGTTIFSGGGSGQYLSLSGGNLYGSLYGPNINGVLYPAQCGSQVPTSWCQGTTPDAWIRAACTQLPASGGVISFLGLTGNIVAPATCSTPTKQVIFIEDPSSLLTITEADGGLTFPLDTGSMFLGPGAGQCPNGNGIRLSPSANIAAIVGPAHTDGTQENFTASGLCLEGWPGATVSQGLIYSKNNFANTEIDNNNAFVCNTACAKIINGDAISLRNNWFNVSAGNNTITGVPLSILASGNGAGCGSLAITVEGGQYEHSMGGGPEISATGAGAGELVCGLTIHGVGIERNNVNTPSTVGVQLSDCQGCEVDGLSVTGTNGGNDLINIAQTATGRTQNVSLYSINNAFQTYPNALNDTTPGGSVLTSFSTPQITSYYSNPGYLQPPVLPGTVIQSLGSDFMSGAGNFSTGSGSLPTGFGMTGCLTAQGLTCTYTRTSSTAPPVSGVTYSQEVQITANTDPSAGFNGIQYSTGVSVTAGQSYIASFWAKGDGSFTGLPTFILWNSGSTPVACQSTAKTPLTTTWTLYTFPCTASSTATLNLAVAALTPVGQTGTFYFGSFVFSQIQPLTPGALSYAVGPYGLGSASLTTTGTSGPATFSNGVLNIPQYSGGGGGGVSSINSGTGAFTFSFSAGAGSCSGTNCTFTGSSSGGGSVTNFIAATGSWPTWLVPSVATSTTTPTLSVSASAIPNSALANAGLTLGSTALTLGATTTTVAGLTLTSPTLTAPTLGTPVSVTLTNGTGLPWTGLTGTPSTTQVPFQSLTTTGTGGPAALSAGVLNIPQYGNLSGSLTTNCLPAASSSSTLICSSITDNATQVTISDAGGLAIMASTPGSATLVAGTGSIPTLPSGSGGFAAPASGGTPYLLKLPATISTGYLFAAAPGTNDGVNESAITAKSPDGHIVVTAGLYGGYASGTWLAGAQMQNAGRVVNVQLNNLSTATCTTSPIFKVIDYSSSTTTSGVSAPTAGAPSGNNYTNTSVSLAFAAGDTLGIAITTGGSGCTSSAFSATADYVSP